MPSENQEVSLLRILIGCGEKAIETFRAGDNVYDVEFLADLERVIEGARGELAALMQRPETP